MDTAIDILNTIEFLLFGAICFLAGRYFEIVFKQPKK